MRKWKEYFQELLFGREEDDTTNELNMTRRYLLGRDGREDNNGRATERFKKNEKQ